jgi:hypothetical protein
MAVKKGRRRRVSRAHVAKQQKLAELAAQLAPPEEEAEVDEVFVDGSIIFENDGAPLSEEWMDEQASDVLRIEPVVWVVLAVALGFTTFITYLIASQPVEP